MHGHKKYSKELQVTDKSPFFGPDTTFLRKLQQTSVSYVKIKILVEHRKYKA